MVVENIEAKTDQQISDELHGRNDASLGESATKTHDPLSIKGYRALSPAEIELINKIKEAGALVGQLVSDLKRFPELDQRWLAMGQTDLQKGFMALARAVARPSTF